MSRSPFISITYFDSKLYGPQPANPPSGNQPSGNPPSSVSTPVERYELKSPFIPIKPKPRDVTAIILPPGGISFHITYHSESD